MTNLFSTPIDPKIIFRSLPPVWSTLVVIAGIFIAAFMFRDRTSLQAQLPERVSLVEARVAALEKDAGIVTAYVEAIARGICLDDRERAVRAGLPCGTLVP